MKTCETCKWWKEVGVTQGIRFGYCLSAEATAKSGADLDSDYDFGCTCHEECQP